MEKFGETPLKVWIALGMIVAFAVILLVIGRTAKKWNAKMIAFGALSIALSFVLSCFRLSPIRPTTNRVSTRPSRSSIGATARPLPSCPI